MGIKVNFSGKGNFKANLVPESPTIKVDNDSTGIKVNFSENGSFKANLTSESVAVKVDSNSAVYIHGEDGATFYPSVSENGTLSWTNDKGLENPDSVSVVGPKGPKGDKGEPGEPGAQGPKGDKGDKGDAFTYSDFTEEQLAGLVGPQGE